MPSDVPWVVVDHELYNKNQEKYGPDELRPYAGQWLAWSLDGSTILAHHRDRMEVARQLSEAGLDLSRVVWERMPEADNFDELL